MSDEAQNRPDLASADIRRDDQQLPAGESFRRRYPRHRERIVEGLPQGREFREVPPEPPAGQQRAAGVVLSLAPNFRDLPILHWLPKYNCTKLGQDLIAGVSVGVLLIPQSLAYAALAGLPPLYGLYSAVIPLFVFALLTSSSKVEVGPVGPVAILINGTIASMNLSSQEEMVQVAIALNFVVGIVLSVLGMMRFGFIANFLAWPVMSGYVTAAAFIIIASQIPGLLGLDTPDSNHFHLDVYHVFANLGTAKWETCLIGLVSLVILLGFKHVHKIPCCPLRRPPPRWFPIQLVVVVISILIVALVNPPEDRVEVVGDIPLGMPSPRFPLESGSQLLELIPDAVVVGIVTYAGSMSLAVAFAKPEGEEISANMELVALGVSSVAGSFFSSFTGGGSFTRSAVNAQLGAKSPISGAITGVMMLMCLLFLAALFKELPKAALSAMVIASTPSLVKWDDAKMLWRSSRTDFIQFLFTFIATVAFGVSTGIIVSVIFSLALLVYRSFKPRITELGRLPGTDVFVDIARYPETQRIPGVVVLRIDGELHFGNIKGVTGFVNDMLESALPPHGRNQEGGKDASSDDASMAIEDKQSGDSASGDIEMGRVPRESPINSAPSHGEGFRAAPRSDQRSHDSRAVPPRTRARGGSVEDRPTRRRPRANSFQALDPWDSGPVSVFGALDERVLAEPRPLTRTRGRSTEKGTLRPHRTFRVAGSRLHRRQRPIAARLSRRNSAPTMMDAVEPSAATEPAAPVAMSVGVPDREAGEVFQFATRPMQSESFDGVMLPPGSAGERDESVASGDVLVGVEHASLPAGAEEDPHPSWSPMNAAGQRSLPSHQWVSEEEQEEDPAIADDDNREGGDNWGALDHIRLFAGRPLSAVVLDGSRVSSMDGSACQELKSLIRAFDDTDVNLLLAAFPGPVRDTMERFGIFSLLHSSKRYLTVQAAIEGLEELEDEDGSDEHDDNEDDGDDSSLEKSRSTPSGEEDEEGNGSSEQEPTGSNVPAASPRRRELRARPTGDRRG